MNFERIRNLREDMDKSQKDVAEYLNCSQVAYSYYELGRRDIPTETLIRLSKYYKCSTDYLLGLTDVKEPYPEKTTRK
ncbi:MAG: helix-turn-helix transcriptional regulator [Lachnospiraceae bacterium]|nr:helix-turn-helix transcriptional regulator [Lachnospiraceae bacterium]